jgi:hypothetical protein
MTGANSTHGPAIAPRSKSASGIPAESARVMVQAKASQSGRFGLINEWHVDSRNVLF